jgi:hypothetical protein
VPGQRQGPRPIAMAQNRNGHCGIRPVAAPALRAAPGEKILIVSLSAIRHHKDPHCGTAPLAGAARGRPRILTRRFACPPAGPRHPLPAPGVGPPGRRPPWGPIVLGRAYELAKLISFRLKARSPVADFWLFFLGPTEAGRPALRSPGDRLGPHGER